MHYRPTAELRVPCQQQLDRGFIYLTSVYFWKEWAALSTEHRPSFELQGLHLDPVQRKYVDFQIPFNNSQATFQLKPAGQILWWQISIQKVWMKWVKCYTHTCSPHPPAPEPGRGWNIPPAHQEGQALRPQPDEDIKASLIYTALIITHKRRH